MITVQKDAEAKLMEVVSGLRSSPDGYYGLYFRFNNLHEQFKSVYQIKIAINIINTLLKKNDSTLFVCKDDDLILLYKGSDKELIEKIIFQLRYLFMDDLLAYHEDGTENPAFCHVMDLAFQWDEFVSICKRKHQNNEVADEKKLTKERLATGSGIVKPVEPQHLINITRDLETLDLKKVIRKQPICAALKNKPVRPVFKELYVNIAHLQQILMPNVNLLGNYHLFKYVTEFLDKAVLRLLAKEKEHMLTKKSVSINLNVNTLLSDDFLAFDESINAETRSTIIIEIDVADAFANMADFIIANKAVQALGYRVCLDRLSSLAFIQLDRESLGCNLVKLWWDNSEKDAISVVEQEHINKAVQKWGPNRIILCRCDNEEAIRYGGQMGISLFQGRFLDRILNPGNNVVN